MPAFPTPALDLILNLADKSAAGRLALSGSRVIAAPSSSSYRIVRADDGLASVRACLPNLSGERAFDDIDLSISTVRIALGIPGQNPFCLAILDTPLPPAAAILASLQSATADLPATKRITLDPAPYAGSFIVTLDANDPFEIPFDAEPDQIKSLAGPNYAVKKRAANAWEISGTEPSQDVAIAVDVTGLRVPLGVTGPIALNTVALAAYFAAQASGTPPTEPKWLRVTLEVDIDGVKVYQNDKVEIARELINLSTLVPTPIPPSDFATLSAAIAGKQPISAQLSAIDLLATTSWGRTLLALTDAGALRTYASLQPLNSQLSAIGALATASYGRGLLTQSDAASLRSYGQVTFANLPDKPSTIAGYGISDLNSLGDARWTQLANLNSLGDARWSLLGHVHPQSEVTNLVTDLVAKAPLASPALTGTPTVPTAANNVSSTQAASTAFVHAVIGDIVGASPGTLDSLKELADAIGDDPNFAVTVANSVATKLSKTSNLSDLSDAAIARTNLGLATVAASGLFADLGGRPSTITGYGITDFNSLGDARWSLLAHTHTFNSLTSRPTSLAGYGIADPIALTSLANNFSLLQTFNAIAASSLAVSQLANPGAPTVTPIGNDEGATWSYKIVAKLSDGTPSAAGPAGTTTHGDQTLDATNKNSLAWTAVPGAASYDVYRTAVGTSPATTGKIANVATNAYIDTGAAGDGAAPPATNATGRITAAGATLASGAHRVINLDNSDASFVIAEAITALPVSGGTIFAYAPSGTANLNSDPFGGSTKPVTLILGPGTYTVTGSTYFITLRSNQKIVGAGVGVSILKVGSTVGQKDSFIRMESGNIDGAFSNLTLDGSLGATAFNCAVRISGATRPKIHDARIFGFVSTIANVHVEDSYRGDFDNVLIENDRAALPGNPYCHGFQVWNATPTDNYHKLNGIRVIGCAMGFHFVQANRNVARACVAIGIPGGLPTLEGMNLDSCNDNDLEIYSYYRGDAGYVETNNEDFPGSPICARNQVRGRLEGNSYDGASLNSVDGRYDFLSFNNGRGSGWGGPGPRHGIYVGTACARATIRVDAYDNQTVPTQADGVYVEAGAADTRIFAERIKGIANQIVDLGTNTSASYWDETSAKQILVGDLGFPARDTVISLARSGVNINGKSLTIRAGDGDIHGSSVAGGNLILQAGAAFTGTPGVDGGDVILKPGGNQFGAGGEGMTRIYNGPGTEVGRFDGLGVANQTPFLIYDINSGTMKRLQVGAPDSAGTGKRLLWIAN